MVPLQCVSAGKTGRISQLMGGVEEVRRLEELGLRRGVSIEVVQSGSPCIILLSGNRLCFRDTDQMQILVEEQV